MASALLLCVAAALLRQLPAAGLSLGFGVAVAFAAGLGPRALRPKLLAVNGVAALLWLILPFSTPGQPLAALGPLSASDAGIRLAALITLKTNAITLYFAGLAANMGPVGVARGLDGLGAPASLVRVLLFTQRYLDLLRQEYLRLAQAAKARGFSPAFNLHTYRTRANMLGMVLVRALDRAERVLKAMQCRGFDPAGSTPPVLNAKQWAGADTRLVTLAVISCFSLAALEWSLP